MRFDQRRQHPLKPRDRRQLHLGSGGSRNTQQFKYVGIFLPCRIGLQDDPVLIGLAENV